MLNSADGLRVEGLSKKFGGTQVLTDISFTIPKGSLLSLLGPSGCGKSTTLNILAGFTDADSGRVLLNDTDIVSFPPNRRDLSLVFQNYALFPHMTVKKNVMYGLKPRRVSGEKAEERYRVVMGLLNIGHLADRHPAALSGGQQQRVALARAIIVEPSLLLLDEPLSNLDAALRREVRSHIRALQQELSQTAVFVTHDQEEALSISDIIAVLNQGRVEQIGTPEELWKNPETVFVAKFMGVENILSASEFRRLASVPAGEEPSRSQADSIGEKEFVGFRPIHGRLADPDGSTATSGAISIACEVVSRSYLGRSVEYVCAPVAAGSDQLKIEIPADQDRGHARGDSVEVMVPAKSLHSLRSEPKISTATEGAM